jgi:hypothetical protein
MAIVYPEQQTPTLKQAVTVSISTAADGLGDILDTKGLAVSAVSLSTVWTSAVLTFRAGNSTSTIYPLFGSTGAELVVTATSSQTVWLNPDAFRGLRYIQPVSGNSTTIVAQTTATNVKFHVSPVAPLPR